MSLIRAMFSEARSQPALRILIMVSGRNCANATLAAKTKQTPIAKLLVVVFMPYPPWICVLDDRKSISLPPAGMRTNLGLVLQPSTREISPTK
jgi:hypothetical protein